MLGDLGETVAVLVVGGDYRLLTRGGEELGKRGAKRLALRARHLALLRPRTRPPEPLTRILTSATQRSDTGLDYIGHMTDLDAIAEDVRVSGRTLRRAAARGAVRVSRLSPRRIVVSPREHDYLRRHWPLLASLMAVLRTQSNVRLAVLFGSLARGEGGESSDVDLLVRFRGESLAARARLLELLEQAAGRPVQIVTLAEAEASPLLLADAVRDGRVLVDRDSDWKQLERRRPAIELDAAREGARLEREAWEALESLGAP